MKLFVVLSLSLFLVACEQAVGQESITPPAVTAPEPEMMAPVEEPPVYVDREPVVEEPVEEEMVEEELVEEEIVEEEPSQTQVFNAQTLANFDGRDGRPTYIAINGVVYDLSTSTRWVNGNHNGFQAGQDLTRAFNAQHGDTRFARFPVVGTYE